MARAGRICSYYVVVKRGGKGVHNDRGLIANLCLSCLSHERFARFPHFSIHYKVT